MKNTVIIFVLSFILLSCKPDKKDGEQLFTLLPSSFTQINFVNQLTETEEFNIIEYLYFNNGAGVSAGDINNDGLTDLYFTSNQEPNKLYLNKGNLQFEDITETSGTAGKGDWKTGVTMADVNGDGFLDIYVCQLGKYKSISGRNQLFINQGNLKFKEEAHDYGIDFQGFSTQAAFFDYDMDGDLDMYLLNHSVHSTKSYGMAKLRLEKDSLAGDRLYRNDEKGGKRFFTNVTTQAGIYSSQIGYGLGINICDIDNDGLPDIYISNDFHENDYLYINNGNGTFSERLNEMIKQTSRSSMGNDIGDINNDGLLDIIVLDMLPDKEKIRKSSGGEDDYELSQIKLELGFNHQFVRNTLQLNLGGGMFSEIGRLAGIYSTDWSWSPLFCDVDNDGWKDLFITNGIFRRGNDLDYIKFLTGGKRFAPTIDNSALLDKQLYEKMPLHPNINYIYKNNGDLTFSKKSEDWGFNKPSFSNGSAYADLDNDGDLDLVVNNINEEAYIYQNNSNTKLNQHFIAFDLKGNGLNTKGIGTRITLYCKDKIQVAEQFPTRGFLSSSTDRLHFGIGSDTIIDSIVVRWPNLMEQKIKNIPADKVITLEMRNADKPLNKKTDNKNMKLFSPAQIPGMEFRHKEDKYVDFYREQLIPHSLSAEGPALAVGDVNGDGLDDVFVGGAKGQPAKMFVQNKKGSFSELVVPQLLINNYAEDVDAVFFDADGDKDMDLYIVRGGNELLLGNAMLADLLLINNGKGEFSNALLPLISHNGSCMRPCDYDNDGDMDLFLGSRSIPGAYGWSPEQFLLENNGQGNFRDVTDAKIKGIRDIGMVTDARWMDYDKDGDNDLVLTGEWMKICLFRNDNGYFTDFTKASGLDETSGWWNCLQVADIDFDGDLDIIGGNLGLNSILKASKKEPVEMYLKDFDLNGTLDQIICSYQDGISYPISSLDELASQITGFGKQHPSYADFGGKTAKDIFGKNTLDESTLKQAVLFESCLFINNGNGTFKISKLPIEAQFSPVRNIIAHDFNKDGKLDMVLAGNNYAARPSYGRYDASYGWCLLGKSGAVFNPLLPVESGLKIDGDARKMTTIKISGLLYLIVTVNDGNLQTFQIH